MISHTTYVIYWQTPLHKPANKHVTVCACEAASKHVFFPEIQCKLAAVMWTVRQLFVLFFFRKGKKSTFINTVFSATHSATHWCPQTVLTGFSNCPPERPCPLGFELAGRSVLVPEYSAHTYTHTLTAMPLRYSHQRRKASTAASRRMERRRRDQGKTDQPTSGHNQRSKKLELLSRYRNSDRWLQTASHTWSRVTNLSTQMLNLRPSWRLLHDLFDTCDWPSDFD